MIALDINSHPTIQQAQFACNIIEEHKCKILFTINEWGLDTERIIHDFILKKSILHLNWCVDDPFFEELILRKKFSSSSCRIDFVSDRDYVDTMNAQGYHAYFLPLGTDPSVFYPTTQTFIHDAAFVGSSYLTQIEEFKNIAPDFAETMIPTIASALNELRHNNNLDLQKILLQKILKTTLPADCSVSKALFICKHIAGFLYRREIVSKLAESFENFAVYGDTGWISCIKKQLLKTVSYGDELRNVYNSTRINIDINRVVIRNGFTQRVFDALACRSFLITSSKPVIQEFFETENKNEIVTFSTAEELTDLVRYFLAHESQRKAIAQRGYEKILKSHTYIHRIQQLFSIVSKHIS
ncbi:MAG TPA: glycosyltransferase [Chitinispirillaceae bacterium]|nr:glycosyltransferase [Chitinispirillaceae bacterium]